MYQASKPTTELTWFDDGPLLTYLPLPVPDKNHSCGMECETCSVCHGHYMDPKGCICKQILCVPSSIFSLYDFFSNQKGLLTENEIEVISCKVLLPPSEVKIWLDHLRAVQRNLKRGESKAAQTRKKKEEQMLHYTPNDFSMGQSRQKQESGNVSAEQEDHEVMSPLEEDGTFCVEYKCGVCEGIYER